MSTANVNSLKNLICGVAALAVTIALSWSFLDSTSVARWAATTPTQMADNHVSQPARTPTSLL